MISEKLAQKILNYFGEQKFNLFFFTLEGEKDRDKKVREFTEEVLKEELDDNNRRFLNQSLTMLDAKDHDVRNNAITKLASGLINTANETINEAMKERKPVTKKKRKPVIKKRKLA